MKRYMSLSDTELLALLKQDDDVAFNEIYVRYWKQVLYYAAQKTGDQMDAENIVQDVFVSLWRRRNDLNISSGFNHYLIVSIKYRVLKFLSRQRSLRLIEEGELSYDILDDSTRQYLDFEELRLRLEELICSLPEKSAIIYRMNKEQGVSHREIAKIMNLSEKAVNSRLVRAKKVLQEGLAAYLYGFLL